MLAANPPTSRLLSTYSKSLSGDRRVHRLPPSRYTKAISCHIPATSRLTTTYSYKNKLEDQPLPEVSGHPQGYNFEALCRIWEGTIAYEAEVAFPSPVRRYYPECRAWRVCTSYRSADSLLPFYLLSSRTADWRRNTWLGSQGCISCQLP